MAGRDVDVVGDVNSEDSCSPKDFRRALALYVHSLTGDEAGTAAIFNEVAQDPDGCTGWDLVAALVAVFGGLHPEDADPEELEILRGMIRSFADDEVRESPMGETTTQLPRK